MDSTTTPRRTLLRNRRRALVLGTCLVLGTAVTACGSDGSEVEAPSGKADICAAVDQYREAEADGDRTSMAAAIRPIVEALPEEIAKQAQAYATSLDGSPATGNPTNGASQRAFVAYADEECGAPEANDDATTTTAANTTTVVDDATPTTSVANGNQGNGTNGGTGSEANGSNSGSGGNGSNSGSGGNGSTESDGSTGSSGNSDPATNGPSEGTGNGG